MKPRRRLRRWLLVIGISLIVLLGAAFAVLRLELNGESLGSNIASILNKRMRGRVHIGAIQWDVGSLKLAVTGGWVPLELTDVKVWDDCALSAVGAYAGQVRTGDPNEDCTGDDHPDPDPKSHRVPRKLILYSPRMTGQVDIHALMFGNHDFVFKSLTVHGGEVLIEQAKEPLPLSATDHTVISLISAFSPRLKPGFRAGIYADSPPPVFDLRDIHIDDIAMTWHMSPFTSNSATHSEYSSTLRLEHVSADPDGKRDDNYLYMNGTDPLVTKFYVRLAATAKTGRIRILDQGPTESFRLTEPYGKGREAHDELFLHDVSLNRLAQLPTEWAKRDLVANTLELDMTARTSPCPTEDEPHPKDSDGATLHAYGQLDNYWDRPLDGKWDLHLDGQNLGPTVHTCIKRKLSGDNVSGSIALSGPWTAMPKLTMDFKNVDFRLPLGKADPIMLTLAEVHGAIDLVNDQGYIEKTKALIKGGKDPGEINLAATFGLRPYNADASIEIVKAIDVSRFLPAQMVAAVGGFLSGKITAKGDTAEGFALDDVDLYLGPSQTSKAMRIHKGRLVTTDDFKSIHVEHMVGELGKNHALVDGKIDIANNDLDIKIQHDFQDLASVLQRLGLPALASGAGGGTVVIKGKLNAPTVTVNTTLTGVPCIGQLKLEDLELQGDWIEIRKMSSPGLGGELTGNARIRRGAVTTIERMNLLGNRLDASRLCGFKGQVSGVIDQLDVQLAGVLDPKRKLVDWLDYAHVYARAEKLDVLGDRYQSVSVCVNQSDDARCRASASYLDSDDLDQCDEAKKKGGACIVASARRAAGGDLDATIAKQKTGQLGGTLALGDLPMGIINQLVASERTLASSGAEGQRGPMIKQLVGGLANLTLHLSGTPQRPEATGAVQLLRAWALGGYLGDATFEVVPAPGKGLAVRGSALAGRLAISGTIGTEAPYPVELAMTGHRIEIDQFVDLTQILKAPDPVQAWVSGTVTVKTQLQGLANPEMWVELSELRAVVDHRTADGRVTPLQLSVVDQDPASRPAVAIHATRTSMDFVCRDGRPCTVRVATPAGLVDFSGGLSGAGYQITARSPLDASGKAMPLDLALLAPLFDQRFDKVSGHVLVGAQIHGSFQEPKYEVNLELHDVQLRPSGTDTIVQVGAECAAGTGWITGPLTSMSPECSQLKLANGSLGFENVKVRVVDEHRDEQGELIIHGALQLDGLTPSAWGVFVEGRLAGKMLPVIAPNTVAQASGVATIGVDRLRLFGKGKAPLVAGSLEFDAAQPLTIQPRGINHEVSFARGSIDVDTTQRGDHRVTRIDLDDVGGKVDNEGLLERIGGDLELTDSALTNARLELDADSVGYKIRDELDLVLSLKGVSLTLANDQWHVANSQTGGITVVSGQYKTNFDLTDRITKLAARNAPAKPFWEQYPTLANADLDLTLHVAKFAVANNVAPNIELTGDAVITNTPRDPRLQGTITVQRGTFRIPGTRATFITHPGSKIDFKDTEKAANPALNVVSEANYTDIGGQLHIITMTINGTLEQPQWDLTTSTGYNKSQTLSLLVLGRNQESLRRSFGDQQLGSTPQTGDVSTNPSQGVADQIVKDLAGDWVSSLLGTSLTSLTGLDVLKFEIGFGSVGFHIEKKLLENVQILGDFEQTIRGFTLNPRAVLKTPYKFGGNGTLQFEGGLLQKTFYDPTELDITDPNIKATYRLFIP